MEVSAKTEPIRPGRAPRTAGLVERPAHVPDMPDEVSAPPARAGRDWHVPLYMQIRTHFLELIQSGKLRPYDRVPSESELSSTFSVSRMTARKAIDQLVTDGLIFRRPGKGTFIAPPAIAHRISTRLSFSSAMRAIGLAQHARVLRAGIVVAPPEVAAELGLGSSGQAVYVQRLRLVEGTPSAIHSTYLQMRFQNLLNEDLTGSLTDLLTGTGQAVVRTRDTVEAVVATEKEAVLLGIPIGAPLVRVDGVGYSASEEPIYRTDGLYRGDCFRFTVDTSGPPDLQPSLKQDDLGAYFLGAAPRPAPVPANKPARPRRKS